MPKFTSCCTAQTCGKNLEGTNLNFARCFLQLLEHSLCILSQNLPFHLNLRRRLRIYPDKGAITKQAHRDALSIYQMIRLISIVTGEWLYGFIIALYQCISSTIARIGTLFSCYLYSYISIEILLP